MKKKLLDFQKEVKRHNSGKSVVFAYGSFNPLTRSDAFLFEHVIAKAKQDKMDVFVFTERKQNSTLPLKFEKKVKLIESAYPEIFINKNRDIRNIVEAVDYLQKNKYQHIHIIAPSNSRNNLMALLENFDLRFTIEEFNGEEGERDIIKEAVFDRDVTLLQKHLPQRLREDAEHIMADLVSGYKVNLSESERAPINDFNIKKGNLVQSGNSDISEVLAVTNTHAVCESIINNTVETYRLDELNELSGSVRRQLTERLIQQDGQWVLVSKTTGRVLRKYGSNKPSDETVAQDEQEIHMFKNMNK